MNDTSLVTVESASLLPFDTSILAGQVGASSIAMYTRDFKAYLAFAGSSEQALEASTLARWRTHLATNTTMSPNTINRMLSAVKRLMKEAATQGYASYEKAEAFKHVDGVKTVALKDRTKQHARTKISVESMRLLTSLPDTNTLKGLRDAALLHTLASSGMRVSELANLKTSQIVQQGRGFLLSIRGKNDLEYRDVHLSVTAHNAIVAWLSARPIASDYVFTSFEGNGNRLTARAMSEVGAWEVVKGYAEKAGLQNVKPHDLRRFVGTQLAKQDIRKAQKALGHKRIDTTVKHYVLDEIEVGLTDNLY